MHLELLKHPMAPSLDVPRAHVVVGPHATTKDGKVLIGPELRTMGEVREVLRNLRADLDRIEGEAQKFLK